MADSSPQTPGSQTLIRAVGVPLIAFWSTDAAPDSPVMSWLQLQGSNWQKSDFKHCGPGGQLCSPRADQYLWSRTLTLGRSGDRLLLAPESQLFKPQEFSPLVIKQEQC
jgi:hypothetical protein